MRITRRQALKFAGTGALVSTLPSWALGALPWRVGDSGLYPALDGTPWPIVQGPTDGHSASFVVLLPYGLEPTPVVARDGADDRRCTIVARFEMPALGLSATQIVADGLAPGRDYTLRLLGPEGDLLDRRIFRTLDVSKRTYRFGLVSCMNDGFTRHAVTMWEALARENCDFVILNGDTCYADKRRRLPGELGLAQRYAETRMRLSWFKLERLVPTFAVWDDHDFGVNNGDRTFPLASFGRQLFRSFWGASDNAVWQKTFGVGSSLEIFGQRFYLLDDRSFRDPVGIAGGTHWGGDQLDGLIGDLGRSHRRAWIVNGTQFTGHRRIAESVGRLHPDDLACLMRGLSQRSTPAVFLSGDIHFSEIRAIDPRQLGYESYEFTSSSIHSTPFPGPIHEENLVAERGHNFMVFDVTQEDGWHIRCRSVKEDNRVAFDHRFVLA